MLCFPNVVEHKNCLFCTFHALILKVIFFRSWHRHDLYISHLFLWIPTGRGSDSVHWLLAKGIALDWKIFPIWGIIPAQRVSLYYLSLRIIHIAQRARNTIGSYSSQIRFMLSSYQKPFTPLVLLQKVRQVLESPTKPISSKAKWMTELCILAELDYLSFLFYE